MVRCAVQVVPSCREGQQEQTALPEGSHTVSRFTPSYGLPVRLFACLKLPRCLHAGQAPIARTAPRWHKLSYPSRCLPVSFSTPTVGPTAWVPAWVTACMTHGVGDPRVYSSADCHLFREWTSSICNCDQSTCRNGPRSPPHAPKALHDAPREAPYHLVDHMVTTMAVNDHQ